MECVGRRGFGLVLVIGAVLFGSRGDAHQTTTGIAEADPGQQHEVVLDDCLVTLMHDVSVPAQKSGVLISVRARAGMKVKKGDVLAEIGNSEARLMVKAAELKVRLVRERAGNDIRVRFAEAAVLAAESEYQQAMEANRSNPGTVLSGQLKRLALAVKRARLEVEQADSELAGVAHQVELAEVELAMAQANLKQHTVAAPNDGVIAEVFVQTGEWAGPGIPICRVIRLDPLYVENFVDLAVTSPKDIAGKQVKIETQPSRDGRASLVGEIVFVSSNVEPSGHYNIRARVSNREVDGHWLLLPGMTVKMTLEVQGPSRAKTP
jgi:HlyD family secretion protein